MKEIKVVAAVIEKEGKILIAQRSKGEFAGLWEFPGGKIEEGETEQQALTREIKEELNINIEVNEHLVTIEHDYSSFHLTMSCYICNINNEKIRLNAHNHVRWIVPSIEGIDWVPADVKVVKVFLEQYKYSTNNNQPTLIYNGENITVKQELDKSLFECDEFNFSVAFISDEGLQAIKGALVDAKTHNKKGRIITSTYNNFNKPDDLRKLRDFFKDSSVKVRVYVCSHNKGFHSKGYLFNNGEDYKILVGSSNLTKNALFFNQEWNIRCEGKKNNSIIQTVLNEYEKQWNDSIEITDEFLDQYSEKYVPSSEILKINSPETLCENKMQKDALSRIEFVRNKENRNKTLIISATGTGKTYLSAFDVKRYNPKKLLYIVHRETIARKSKESFEKIIKNKKMSLFTGNTSNKEDVIKNNDYLFSTINTICKEEYMHLFNKDYFDYIIIDEVHKAGSSSYIKVLDYFNSKFVLGMSATPERTDDPEKIFKLFDYSVAYEIRLKQAMDYDLLCPFHYYGIKDLSINGKIVNEKTQLKYLASQERVDYIVNAIKEYGYSGKKVHGLIFTSSVEEAEKLSSEFNNKTTYKTVALSGKNNEDERESAMQKLEEEDTNKDYLDFIFTRDLFNEGIDIPCVNLIIMLRNTESSIVFIQQLGRGLRKNSNKEYVNVIDFIGNYKNNFYIPIALSGIRTYRKEDIRRFVNDVDKYLPGPSTVSFDEISRKAIFDSISVNKIDGRSVIKQEYKMLKAKLGNRIPKLVEFDEHNSIDPINIFNSYKSYYEFLVDINEIKNELNDEQKLILNLISRKFANGKRIYEIAFIDFLLSEFKTNLISEYKKFLKDKYNITISKNKMDTVLRIMDGEYYYSNNNPYFQIQLITKDGKDYKLSDKFKTLINNSVAKESLMDLIEFGAKRFIERYSKTYNNTDFVLYETYGFEEITRFLDWEKDPVKQNVAGYSYNSVSNSFPVTINYSKKDDCKTISYTDRFIDQKHLIANSKEISKKEIEDGYGTFSICMDTIKKKNADIHIFIRKNIDDNEYYYLGQAQVNGKFTLSEVDNKKVYEIPYILHKEVRDDIYKYLIS